MKSFCKIIIFTVLIIIGLTAGLYFSRNIIVAAFLENYLSSISADPIQIDELTSRPFKGLNRWYIEIAGTVESTPFKGSAQVSLRPLAVLKHRMSITNFPLEKLNGLTRPRWNFGFAGGFADIYSRGSLSQEKLNIRAKVQLNRYKLTPDSDRKFFPDESGFLGLLTQLSGVSVNVLIQGDPHNPEITWKEGMPVGLELMQKLFMPTKPAIN